LKIGDWLKRIDVSGRLAGSIIWFCLKTNDKTDKTLRNVVNGDQFTPHNMTQAPDVNSFVAEVLNLVNVNLSLYKP
jgi:hypothetical protein